MTVFSSYFLKVKICRLVALRVLKTKITTVRIKGIEEKKYGKNYLSVNWLFIAISFMTHQ